MPQDFNYADPSALYFLLFLPVLFLLFWMLYKNRIGKLKRIGAVWPRIIVPRENLIFWSKVAALALAWTAGTIALMQPRGNAHYPKEEVASQEVRMKAHEIYLLIDASASMSISDTASGTRLQRAKEITDEFLSQLKGERASLYAYTSVLTKMSPLTMDYFFLRVMLKELQINESGIAGTDFLSSLSSLPESAPEKLRTVIILSDGGDTNLEKLPKEQQQAYIQSVTDLFDGESSLNLRIFTVGLGKEGSQTVPGVTFEGRPVESALDDRLLKALAEKGLGNYYEADSITAIEISQDIISRMQSDRILLQKGPTAHSQELLYDLYFQIPLGIAILLLSYVLLLPDTWRLRRFILVGLLLADYSYATTQKELTEANLYAEAGDSAQAIAGYTALLQHTKEAWKKNILLYNLGTLYVNDGDWAKAIETFQTVANTERDPLLARRFRKNFALALYQKAVLEDSDHLQKIYMLRTSTRQLNLAKQANCNLQLMEGLQACLPDQELERFSIQVKQALASALAGFELERTLTVQDALLELLHGLSLLENNSVLLQQNGSPNDYQGFFLHESESWIPLWKTSEKLFVTKEQKILFEQAFRQFSEAIKAVERAEYGEGQSLADKSKTTLIRLLREVVANSTPEDLLQRLILLYRQSDTVREALLDNLQAEQNQLFSVLPDDSLLRPALAESSRHLQQANQSLQQGKAALAELFFKAAYYRIQQLLPEENNPRAALDSAIATQEHAAGLNRLGVEEEEAKRLIIQSQNDTLLKAEAFHAAVFREQTLNFARGICQKRPWDAYLPIFNRGYLSAQDAVHLLAEGSEDALVKQEETLTQWKHLLAAMQNKQEEPPEENKREEELPAVLQLLQEMNNDDQIQKKSPEPTKQQVQRPW